MSRDKKNPGFDAPQLPAAPKPAEAVKPQQVPPAVPLTVSTATRTTPRKRVDHRQAFHDLFKPEGGK